ncbi:hypothetical protein [Kitasatospora sp. NPDC001547]|uniref:hypothetical protein n=1 Tax=Kitasatospora sp. NPDC001547 TaxID=3364015 RepID=UPI00369545F4|nr:hypothetical protein KitaXyl93_73880 [Kitasatospora sp. Xyl93]
MRKNRTVGRALSLVGAALALASVTGLMTATSASAADDWSCARNPRGWDHMN